MADGKRAVPVPLDQHHAVIVGHRRLVPRRPKRLHGITDQALPEDVVQRERVDDDGVAGSRLQRRLERPGGRFLVRIRHGNRNARQQVNPPQQLGAAHRRRELDPRRPDGTGGPVPATGRGDQLKWSVGGEAPALVRARTFRIQLGGHDEGAPASLGQRDDRRELHDAPERIPAPVALPATGLAIAPRVVGADRALRDGPHAHEQQRAIRIELEVDALGHIAEIDRCAPHDFELRVGLEKLSDFVGPGGRPCEWDGPVDAEREAVRLREPAAVHRGEFVAHRHGVRRRRTERGRRCEAEGDRIAPLHAARDRGCDGEDALRIDGGVERSRNGAIEGHGDDRRRRGGVGRCDPEDTERCRAGHDETADGERNDGGERAHTVLIEGFIIAKSKKGTSHLRWSPR